MSKYVMKLGNDVLRCDSCGCLVQENAWTIINEPETNEDYVLCLACYNDAFTGEDEQDSTN